MVRAFIREKLGSLHPRSRRPGGLRPGCRRPVAAHGRQARHHGHPSLRPANAEIKRRPFCGPEKFSSGYIMRSRASCSSRAAGALDAHAGVPPGTGDPAKRRPWWRIPRLQL